MRSNAPNQASATPERTAETATEISRTTDRAWRRWGPYLGDRQWGTVREDYSADGEAWRYFTHDQARSRAYRWGEDGIGGFCDHYQRLCFAPAFWNGRDQILKERLFGLSGKEGNHGEDVKELYYYLDGTPSHSYMKMLYKYPHAAFPYDELIRENRRRGKDEGEYELLDTGVFDEGRYHDIYVEYAKAATDDILIRITAWNRGTEPAPLSILPHLWFRNTWSWDPQVAKPVLADPGGAGVNTTIAVHPRLGRWMLTAERAEDALYCDNETNAPRLFGAEAAGYFKDGINDAVVDGRLDAVNPERTGTRMAFHTHSVVEPDMPFTVRLRLRALSDREIVPPADEFDRFDDRFAERVREADEFYRPLQTGIDDSDARLIQRQAYAGLLWSKQFYHYDVRRWLDGDPTDPPPPAQRRHRRNAAWTHLNNADVISMPDTWEYPWYAAWDLAFHCVAFAAIDPAFAKEQLLLLTRVWYLHPNGQLPAYEWEFSDVNPPVHAWAAWRVFQIDRKQTGEGDFDFLERQFHKLMLNFTWWVNRKDVGDRNIFQGGFLGLDNIGILDRSKPLPTGGHLNQADGTSWMAMYCLNLMRIALELATRNRVYEDVATKFFEHFLHIAEAMTHMGDRDVGLWNEEDGFFYDVLDLPDDTLVPLRLRSMVGLVPLFAVETLEPELLAQLPDFSRRMDWLFRNRPRLAELVSRWDVPGVGERKLLSLLRGHRFKAILKRALDPAEFLSDFGIRSLSRVYAEAPYRFECGGQAMEVGYEPAESRSGLFGGNSNWRGPVWFPVNYLLIESLQKFHHYYGDEFRIECPTGSGVFVSILEVAEELARRLERIFLRDSAGRRPVNGGDPRLDADGHFRDNVLFYEYFHGDTGRGLGASHQTGWTALVAKLLAPRASPGA